MRYLLVGGMAFSRRLDAVVGRRYAGHDSSGGAGLVRSRLLGLPPGIISQVVADGPAGVRRSTRTGPVFVPGRRERRVGPRPAAGRVHRRAVGAEKSRLVLVAAVAAMVILFRVGLWYRAHLAERVAKRVVATSSPVSSRQAAFAIGILLVPDLLEILLPDESDQLLHALPDRHVRGLRSGRATPAVRVPRGGGGRNVLRRPGRDRVGFKVVIWGSILGVLPFTLALPYVEPVLDDRPYGRRSA